MAKGRTKRTPLPEGFHKHKCLNCNFIWAHGEGMRGNIEAHTCPKCGKRIWSYYHGRARANFVGCGPVGHGVYIRRPKLQGGQGDEPPLDYLVIAF